MARVSKLRCHVGTCRRGNILKTFLMKMGVFSYDKNPHSPQNYKKNSLFVCVCVFYVYSSEKTIGSMTTQHFNNNCTPKKTHKKTKKTASSLPVQRKAGENFPTKN